MNEIFKKYLKAEKLKQKYLEQAIDSCIKKIRGNLIKFSSVFPTSSSLNYVYTEYNEILINDDWTSGFWTGLLWMSYEYTHDEKFKKVAMSHRKIFQTRLKQQLGLQHHDWGFLYIPSVIAQNKVVGDEISLTVGLQAAELLYKTRFNKKIGFLQAWGDLKSANDCKMIIDSFLNIPLLFWRYSITGEKPYQKAALQHINLATKLLIRNDWTTYHTYFFNQKTGVPIKGETVQGYSNESCWARGQAWGIYGMVLSYQYTNDEKYYEIYLKLVEKFVKELPTSDGVPYWDLNFSDDSGEPRDTSALTIATSAILTMRQLKQSQELEWHQKFVYQSIITLIENYSTFKNEKQNGLLTDGVYNKNSENGVNESNLWGDYYFLDTLLKLFNSNWKGYW